MIKVYSGPHVKFAALLMVEQLVKLGHTAEWVPKVDPRSNDLWIIYQAVRVVSFPKKYIVCQTEPRGSHWFTTEYQYILDRAIAIWDYSAKNILSYGCGPKMKIALVRPGVKPQPVVEKDIDYLFYGWIDSSSHRQRMIEELSKKINLTVVTDKLEDEMWAMLARTKVVINIQYKPGNPMEGYRICEALSHGCKVITEGFDPHYLGAVMFADECWMLNKLPFSGIIDNDLAGMDNLEEIKEGLKIAGIL